MDKTCELDSLKILDKNSLYSKWLFNLIKRFINPNDQILEVGCGIGNITKFLIKGRFDRLYAIDVNRKYLGRACKIAKKRARIGFGDIEKGKYFFPPDKRFDSIICLNVLEHIKDDAKALKNISRLLKKDGKLILLVPSDQKNFTRIDLLLGHHRRYGLTSLVSILEMSHFKVVSIRHLNMLGAMGWFISGRILKRSSIKSSDLSIFTFLSRPFLFAEKYIHPPFGLSLLAIAYKV